MGDPFSTPAASTRARRFPVQLTLRFRPKGQQEWHTGSTVDISHTGVLFEADQPLPVATPLELRVLVQFEDGHGPAPEIVCYGRVAREDQGNGRPRLAASLFAYEFLSRRQIAVLAHHLAGAGPMNRGVASPGKLGHLMVRNAVRI